MTTAALQSTLCPRLLSSTCAPAEGAALPAGGGAAVALPVARHVRRRTLLDALVLVQEEGLFAAQAVGGVLPAGGAARRAAPAHLGCGKTPAREATRSRHDS